LAHTNISIKSKNIDIFRKCIYCVVLVLFTGCTTQAGYTNATSSFYFQASWGKAKAKTGSGKASIQSGEMSKNAASTVKDVVKTSVGIPGVGDGN
jgi:hypothetical protein